MWPWEHVGVSAADGILDDETYDWIPVMRAMDRGGSPIVVSESLVDEANKLARKTTAINASHTGTAGLAGLMAAMDGIDPGERVAVVFSGVSRSSSDAEAWIEQQIRAGMERGEFENLPGKGKPLDAIQPGTRRSARRGLVVEGQASSRAAQLPAADVGGAQGTRGGA